MIEPDQDCVCSADPPRRQPQGEWANAKGLVQDSNGVLRLPPAAHDARLGAAPRPHPSIQRFELALNLRQVFLLQFAPRTPISTLRTSPADSSGAVEGPDPWMAWTRPTQRKLRPTGISVQFDRNTPREFKERTRMKTFTIDNDNNISVFATQEEADAASSTPFDSFASPQELADLAAQWPAERLLAVWNSLPGVTPVEKVQGPQDGHQPDMEAHPEPGRADDPEGRRARTEGGSTREAEGGTEGQGWRTPPRARARQGQVTQKASPAKNAPKDKKAAKAQGASAPREGQLPQVLKDYFRHVHWGAAAIRKKSPTPARSWPPTWRRTSPARRCSSTAARWPPSLARDDGDRAVATARSNSGMGASARGRRALPVRQRSHTPTCRGRRRMPTSSRRHYWSPRPGCPRQRSCRGSC